MLFDANHQGLYENICGNNPVFWSSFLKELGIKENSILAGYTIYKFYLSKTNDQSKAFKDYKGIKSKKNYWIVKKLNRVIKEVKEKHIKEESYDKR